MTIKSIVAALKKKLTKSEFLELQELLDSEPPAGPLCEAITEEAIKMAPELFTTDGLFGQKKEKE